MKPLLFSTLALGAALLLLSTAAGQPGPKDRPREGNLQVGDVAPDFTLKTLGGKSEAKLSSQRGQRPVVLVFGSYT